MRTGKGDDGTTALYGTTERVSKACGIIKLIGNVDTFNTKLGDILANMDSDNSYWNQTGGEAVYPEIFRARLKLYQDTRIFLKYLQHKMFDLGAYLADQRTEPSVFPHDEMLRLLDDNIKEFNKILPPLSQFILPGGNDLSVLAHEARVCCRHVERKFVGDVNRTHDEQVKVLIPMLNAMSTYLFNLARFFNYAYNRPEECYKPNYDWDTVMKDNAPKPVEKSSSFCQIL
jgi:cob(I)alamin adenosyltransferase